ncbi:hypothetical protein [Jannaschia sp. LMIT008]|uniref:hypothetical protein n=1 Tax=Jannaschia maritima TaxID=3032585 RepID=UPI0028120BD5|nr:hypothetical protein [Jannaschia sp. LMIT008]
MIVVLTHRAIANPGVLEVRQLPRRVFGRVFVRPRGAGPVLWLRLLAEVQLLRYLLALVPLGVIAVVWRETALPLSQAPILMVILIVWIEMRVLRPSPKRRARLIDPVEADRGLDVLKVRGRAILTRVAAGRGLRAGTLRLVVEQSDLGLLPPLTFVSVQSEDGPEVLDLMAEEQAMLRDDLFGPPLTERDLHRIGLARDEMLHEVAFDTRGVSAHARLEAALAG